MTFNDWFEQGVGRKELKRGDRDVLEIAWNAGLKAFRDTLDSDVDCPVCFWCYEDVDIALTDLMTL